MPAAGQAGGFRKDCRRPSRRPVRPPETRAQLRKLRNQSVSITEPTGPRRPADGSRAEARDSVHVVGPIASRPRHSPLATGGGGTRMSIPHRRLPVLVTAVAFLLVSASLLIGTGVAGRAAPGLRWGVLDVSTPPIGWLLAGVAV